MGFALLVLLVPLLMAAKVSEDSFSMSYLDKWGKIERKMQQMRLAEKRAKAKAAGEKMENPYVADAVRSQDGDTPPEGEAASGATEGDTPPEGEGDEWGEFTLEDLKKMVPQSSSGDFLLDVPQIFYTAGDQELMGVMEGIPVETTAQLMKETEDDRDGTLVRAFRLFVECCAADARPMSIGVLFEDGAPEFKELDWFILKGTLHFQKDELNESIPLLKMKTMEPTTEPLDGLMY